MLRKEIARSTCNHPAAHDPTSINLSAARPFTKPSRKRLPCLHHYRLPVRSERREAAAATVNGWWDSRRLDALELVRPACTLAIRYPETLNRMKAFTLRHSTLRNLLSPVQLLDCSPALTRARAKAIAFSEFAKRSHPRLRTGPLRRNGQSQSAGCRTSCVRMHFVQRSAFIFQLSP